ncbi:MAG: ribosomal protein S18-alanine N-acetyltransferase [Candidatus Acidiferrum sp.]
MQRFFGRVGPGVEVESRGTRAVLKVRTFRIQDAGEVHAISQESPKAAHWSRKSYVELAEEDDSRALVIEADRALTGFLIGRCVADQAEILNLAISLEHRRKGQGATLLAEALQDFRLRGATSVYLEVRESNTIAIAFYEKQGFAKTGLRKGYYRDPDEPAVTMVRKLTG